MMDKIQVLVIMAVPFLFSLTLHEYAHARVAKMFGDTTAEDEGRLTLNPLPHIDLMWTIIMPIMFFMLSGFVFGGAKPVPIRPSQFTQYRKGLFWVAAAGPISNIILAAVFSLVFVLIVGYVSQDFVLHKPFATMAQGAVYINLVLCFFNLIPIPPLDGSKMVESFLSYDAAMKFEVVKQYSFYIFMAMLFLGGFRLLVAPPVEFFSTLFIGTFASIFGVA